MFGETFVLYSFAAFAGHLGFCPWGPRRPCPDPLKPLLGLVFGVIAALAYDLLFLGKRALEVNDLFAVALIAFLFSYFINILFFPKREA
jgi:hypothetical protein